MRSSRNIGLGSWKTCRHGRPTERKSQDCLCRLPSLLSVFRPPSVEKRIGRLKLGRKTHPTLRDLHKTPSENGVFTLRRQGPAALGVLAKFFGIARHMTTPWTPPSVESESKKEEAQRRGVLGLLRFLV